MQILRDGDAYVGITSKPVAMVALQTFDPVRYAPLSMANPHHSSRRGEREWASPVSHEPTGSIQR